MSKNLSKYVAAFDYVDKTLILLSAISKGISVTSFASVIGVPAGIACARFSLVFFLATGITKRFLSITRKKQKKHNKIVMLAKSKLINIETIISQLLIDFEIIHEEFKTVVNEKEKYARMKKDIGMIKSSDELKKDDKKLN